MAFGKMGARGGFGSSGLLGGAGNSWVPRPSTGTMPVAAIDLAGGRVYGGSLASLLSTTRASPATTYAPNKAGLLIPFAANTPRITDIGILPELSRTNYTLWNRDFTNAAWTKTNCTAAKNQTGADGVANAASSLTATAANATVLQTSGLASNGYFVTAYIKRLTGTGEIDMTMDGGTTWTPIQSQINTSQLLLVSIPPQTLASASVGFRIVTSGDAIAVDFFQNEAGTKPSSPLATTSVAVVRSADVITVAGVPLTALQSGTASFLAVTPPQKFTPAAGARLLGSNSPVPLTMASDTQAQSYNGTAFVTATINYSGSYTQNTVWSASSWNGSSTTVAANGGTPVSNANGMAAITTAYLGSSNGGNAIGDFISMIAIWDKALSSSELVSLTSPGAIFDPGAVIAWGNSFTGGNQDHTGVTYPRVLSAKLGVPVYNQGVGGQTSSQILTRFLAFTSGWGNPTILEMGRNDFSAPATVKANIASAVAALTTNRYLIMSILPSSADVSGDLATIATLNSDLAALYGSRFIDVLTPLQAANDGSANDLADVAAGLTPRSLRFDALHLNAAGYTIYGNEQDARKALLGF